MATYLQGVTDYIPEIQPFQPNLNFYKGVLDTKQAQYQAGYDRISKIYGQLLNSPLTRDINIERREDFFNNINNEIQKLSGVDLSLRQNQDAAYQVFQPLINDQNILKDMAWTKVLRDEYQKSESFKNCTNEEKCGGKWWEGGVQALNFMRMDFANASDEEAMQMGNAYYTPYVNVTDKAFKMAKDMGFNVQSVTWSSDGKYIVTTKGGQALVAPLNDYFNSVLGQDPKVQDYYKTLAYLDRKNFSYTNVEKYGSEAAAEKFYLNNKIEYINNLVNQQKEQTENLLNGIKTDKAIIEQNKDLDPELNKNVYDYYLSLSQDEEVLNQSLDNTNNTGGLVDRSTLLDADLNTLRDRVDQGMSSILLQQDLFNAAINYAKLNNEVDIKADPYEEASFKHGLQMEEMKKKFEYDLELKKYEAAFDLITGKGGKGGRDVGKRLGSDSFMAGSDWTPIEGAPGSTAKIKNLFESAGEALDKEAQSYAGVRGVYLFNYYNDLKTLLDNPQTSDAVKSKAKQSFINSIGGQAKYDEYVNKGYIDKDFNIANSAAFGSIINNYADSDGKLIERIKTEVNSLYNTNILNSQRKSDYDGMYAMYDVNKQIYNADLKNYQEGIKTVKTDLINRIASDFDNSKLESEIADYKKGTQNKRDDYRAAVSQSSEARSYEEWANSKINNLESKIANNNVQRQYKQDALNALFDKNGKIVDEETFVNTMYNKYMDKTNAAERFRNRTKGWDFLPLVGGLAPAVIVRGIRETQNFFTGKQDKGELRDQYQNYVKGFKDQYSSGGLKAYPQGTHRYANGSSTMVDFADINSEGLQSTITVIDNFNKVKGKDKVGAFLGTEQGNINKLGPADTFKENAALVILNDLETAYQSSWDYDDRERPIVKFSGYNIAYNDANQVAYTIELNEDYMRKNMGTATNPGKYWSYFENGNLKEGHNIVTVSMPRDLADNYYNNITQETIYDKMYNLNIPINITNKSISSEEPDYNFTIKKNQFDQGLVTGYVNMYQPDATWRKSSLEEFGGGASIFDPASGVALDLIVNKYKNEIGQAITAMNINTYSRSSRRR